MNGAEAFKLLYGICCSFAIALFGILIAIKWYDRIKRKENK